MPEMICEPRGDDFVETRPEYEYPADRAPAGSLDALAWAFYILALALGIGIVTWKLIAGVAVRMGPAWTLAALQTLITVEAICLAVVFTVIGLTRR